MRTDPVRRLAVAVLVVIFLVGLPLRADTAKLKPLTLNVTSDKGEYDLGERVALTFVISNPNAVALPACVSPYCLDNASVKVGKKSLNSYDYQSMHSGKAIPPPHAMVPPGGSVTFATTLEPDTGACVIFRAQFRNTPLPPMPYEAGRGLALMTRKFVDRDGGVWTDGTKSHCLTGPGSYSVVFRLRNLLDTPAEVKMPRWISANALPIVVRDAR